ncbi:MAG: hypothetical protein GY765_24040, partial [bacterium]|nr:hypothetical protein [bacterium]
MKPITAILIALSLLFFTVGCGEKAQPKKEENVNWQLKAETFLKSYLAEYDTTALKQTLAYWEAATTGKKEHFEAYSAADLALKKLHSNKKRYEKILDLLKHKDALKPITHRALTVAEIYFKANQLPEELLEKMTTLQGSI